MFPVCWRCTHYNFSSARGVRSSWIPPSGTTPGKGASINSPTKTSFSPRRSPSMADDRDHYENYYADKLWNLLPAIYRTEVTDSFDTPGHLRELLNRIGAQAAILRRSIDRLWEDQSIEACDDWVIP